MSKRQDDRQQRKISETEPHFNRQRIAIWSVVAIVIVAVLFLILPLKVTEKPVEEETETAKETEPAAPSAGLYDDLEHLQLNVLYEKELDNGETEYLIEIVNETNRVILQPTLYFSIDVTSKSGRFGNPFRYSTHLGLEIEPGQTMKTPLTVDVGLLNEETIDRDHIMIELQGYLDELQPENMFHTGQSVSNVEEEGDGQWDKQ